MPVGGDPVQDHATEPEQLVVGPEAVGQRGDRLSHRGHVDHQYDRRAQQPGELCRGLRLGTPGEPVVQAHRPFDHGDVGAGGPVREQWADRRGADQPRVEIAARPAGGQAQVRGVDVVRPHLEPGRLQAARPQRGEQPDSHRRLAVAGGRGGDHDPGYGGH